MKRILGLTLALIMTIALAGGAALKANEISSAKTDSKARKIVVFEEGVSEKQKEDLFRKHNITKNKNLSLINGVAAELSQSEEADLKSSDEVLRIDDDIILEAFDLEDGLSNSASAKSTSQPAQVMPWGIGKVNASNAWSTTTGDPIKVAVIDTGISTSHPDLKGNLIGGISEVWYTSNYNDDNGHGTHVAGTIGALNNTIGVVGVGPQIDLYAVKVLDRRGSGYLSDIIDGLSWAVANKMQVVNMSLGSTVYNESFAEAVLRVNNAGIVQVVAAGNNGPGDNTVNYPAKFPEVIAVSAIDSAEKIASWSSRGPEVDLTAPGASIYSTYKGQSYTTLSGTSMASPHVAGVAALALDTPVGAYDLDSDGAWDPIEVKNKLEATATDLGLVGRDNLYGAGLVNAQSAVMP